MIFWKHDQYGNCFPSSSFRTTPNYATVEREVLPLSTTVHRNFETELNVTLENASNHKLSLETLYPKKNY